MRALFGRGARSGFRNAAYSSLEPRLQKEIDRIRSIMADAVESTKYIADSAEQAYLETDPAQRELPERYYLRYLNFSHTQVLQALREYEKLSEQLGAEKIREVESTQNKFALTVADALLARDHLKAKIRDEEEKSQTKQTAGLNRRDLTFCD